MRALAGASKCIFFNGTVKCFNRPESMFVWTIHGERCHASLWITYGAFTLILHNPPFYREIPAKSVDNAVDNGDIPGQSAA